MTIRNYFSTRPIQKFMFEFESMLDSTEDEYDFGVEAQKFDNAMPLSISFIANGRMEVIYFTDSYVMNYVASLVFDAFEDEDICLRVINKFDNLIA